MYMYMYKYMYVYVPQKLRRMYDMICTYITQAFGLSRPDHSLFTILYS